MTDEGLEPGDICNRAGCVGVINYPEGDCSCHISPPCGYCTEAELCCDECGWRESDSVQIARKVPEPEKLKAFLVSVRVEDRFNDTSERIQAVFGRNATLESIEKWIDGFEVATFDSLDIKAIEDCINQ